MAQRAVKDAAKTEYIQTKQPLDGGRVGRPENLDKTVSYFISYTSSFTTGQVLAVGGGLGVSEGQIAANF